MALSIIGAGFGRTGTMSLKLALEQLGLGPCHHMNQVFQNPSQLPYWQAAALGRAVDWDEVFRGYQSMVDWPGAHYWRELADHYPEAKVILSVRPPERWWESFNGTIRKILEMGDQIADAYPRAIIAMANIIVAQKTFHGRPGDKETALAAFQKRIDDVRAAIPAGRLLIFDVSQGWAPLCAFLGCAVPDHPFPRSNTHQEFWQHFGGQEPPG